MTYNFEFIAYFPFVFDVYSLKTKPVFSMRKRGALE